MKSSTIVATVALACGLSVTPAFAQTAEQDLQQYMSNHPALQANPSLMNNPTYLADHPDLRNFIANHPQVDNRGYGAYGRNWGRGDLDQYTSTHPDLRANPSLMNDPNYLASHPDLRNFLADHRQLDNRLQRRYGANDRNWGRGADDRRGESSHHRRGVF
jgi:hypothetical protein